MKRATFLDIAQEISARANKVEPGDYVGEDGLWYCGKCKTPKQGRYETPFGVIAPMHMCECRMAAYEQKMRQQQIEELEVAYSIFKGTNENGLQGLKRWFDRHSFEKSEKLVAEHKRVLRHLCFTEKKMLNWTFENDDKKNAKTSHASHNFVKNFEQFYKSGQGICFYGDVGTGKSYHAACIANALIDMGRSVFMTNFDWIRNKVQEDFGGKQDFLDSLNTFDLLILDDIGSEADTKFMQEIVFAVIDARSRAGLPLIVTTNLTVNQMNHAESLTERRIYSRVLGMCLPVKVEGTDRRQEQLKANANDLKDLLGI